MPLLIALHDGDDAVRDVLEESVWQLSESHWTFGTGLMVVTAVSPTYLSRHLSRTLERAGLSAALMVTRLDPEACLDALPPEGQAWLRASLPVPS